MKHYRQSAVKRIEVPEQFISLAQRRTQDFLSAWIWTNPMDLKMLMASCYLQGVEDGARAVERERGK